MKSPRNSQRAENFLLRRLTLGSKRYNIFVNILAVLISFDNPVRTQKILSDVGFWLRLRVIGGNYSYLPI